MMRTWNIVLLALLVSAGAASATTSDKPENEQCTNYGFFHQVSVAGDNSYSCTAQYCVNGGAGAGSAGVGVGTAQGSGEAGASATAGTGCTQDNAGDPEPSDPGPAEIIARFVTE